MTGILTEGDYLQKVVLDGHNSTQTSVNQVMNTVIHVTPDSLATDCMDLLADNNMRHLPVCEASDPHVPVGLVSMGDLVKFVKEEQAHTMKYLNEFLLRQHYEYTSV